MSTGISPTRSPEHGETLKLGPPAAGEVIIVVDPSATGATFAAGTQTLRPDAQIPVHRHLDRDAALFIHKGQGRAILNDRTMIVLPGAMLHVPRGAWHGVRNTGTGDLQIAWVSSPGLEAFFRDLSRAGASPSAQVFQELAQRHRIEFRQDAGSPAPAGQHRRGRRGGRRHRAERQPAHPGPSGSPALPLPARAKPSLPAPVAPGAGPASSTVADASAASRAPREQRRRRHRRGGAGRRPAPSAAPQELRAKAGGAASVPPPAATSQSARPDAGRQRSPRGRYQRRAREVYMGGQWVRVEGEGPTIAPGGSPWRGRRGPKGSGDDEPPGVPLSVPL